MSDLPNGYTPTNRRMMSEPKPKVTKRYAHYRPVGFLVVVSFLTLTTLLDHGVPVYMAVLITMLVALLTVMFS